MYEVVIYTDGSISKNGKPDAFGGWAAILQALKVDETAECSNCNYKGHLDTFKDTECDGDVLGTCPKCHKNRILITNDEKIVVTEKEISGKVTYETDNCPVTNNRTEMYGIIKGLEEIKGKNWSINVYSDSEICINTLNGKYRANANHDLWLRLSNLCQDLRKRDCRLYYNWVRGHNGNALNERCDKLAGEAKKG
jgi:ribonuclease HI